ncbi:hypothetical protein [Mongoliibacter ruber]|uniref:Uncharacterized protein n=1 Tax=Mongoliibacter ruber TaxID=1750599 RepID=A0A2T0WNB1_9BACT|nr:hypothetical protein [Mongoliibacter ruber]PRY88186.1 hypothetical protein CLW00_105308 [Mongoliibacter ruber]
MRLSEKDIEKLHYHINAKQIPYIEVRDEVLDHYQTALELEQKRSMEEVLNELDQTFCWSTIRQMEKQQVTLATRDLDKLLLTKISLQNFNKLTIGILALLLALNYSLYCFMGFHSFANLTLLMVFALLAFAAYASQNIPFLLAQNKAKKAIHEAAFKKHLFYFNVMNFVLLVPSFMLHHHGYQEPSQVLIIGYAFIVPSIALLIYIAIKQHSLPLTH